MTAETDPAEEVDAAFESYEVGDTCVVMLCDRANPHAWIQSDYVMENEP